MKKVLILLMTAVLLTSCFGKDAAEDTVEDIVSNVVEVTSEETEVETPEVVEEDPVETSTWTTVELEEWEQVVSGSDNDPRVTNTEGEWTNPPETQTPSVPTESSSNPEEQEIIKDFEEELDGLFDLLESDEG